MIGKTDAELFPARMAEKFSGDDNAVLQEGKALHDEEEYRTNDGSDIWIERVKAPIRDGDGNIVGIQVMFWDVTQRKAAEQALEHERYLLRTLLENVPDSIYFKDKQSRFLRVSRSMAKKFGYEKSGRHLRQVRR